MRLPIESIQLFEALDRVRDQLGVEAQSWAIASGLKPPRISELRTIAELFHSGKNNEKTGRAFTYEKLSALFAGLKSIAGAERVMMELRKQLKKLKSGAERRLILFLIAEQEDPETLEKHLELVTKSYPDKKDK